jgi:hypothetical protein
MRVRADQVRVGHRLGGAVVTKVRPTLDWGVVRITVEHADAPERPPEAATPVPSGTFSYLPDDIVDVQREIADQTAEPIHEPTAPVGTASRTVLDPAGAPAAPVSPTPLRPSTTTRRGFGGGLYRVEYLASSGDGHIVVRADDSTTTSLVGHALDLLEEKGIEARIRRIVPLDRSRLRG